MKKLLFLMTVFCSALNAQDTTGCNNRLAAVLWVQQSAEYKALCHQAYNIARWRIDCHKKNKRDQRPLAIVTDIDETILDNSNFEAERIKACLDFNPSMFREWVNSARAKAVPGAISFLQYASKKRVTIFYVSNRDTSEVEKSIQNLQQLGFPNADRRHMLFASNTPSKEIRRQIIAKDYNIIMLLGDNLNDFSAAFESKNSEDRSQEVREIESTWGERFIVLPNPMYGDWESAILQYKRWSDTEKQSLLREQLVGFN